MINNDGNICIKITDKDSKKIEKEEKTKTDPTKNIDIIKRSRSPIKKSNRCAKCNKKLTLTAIKCKCDNLYCSEHIFHTDHGCTFDYKKAGKELLEKNNPSVNFSKVDKM